MSTWKYGYQLDYPIEWLFQQSRKTEQARGKLEQLKNDWLGRDEAGNLIGGSGTAGLNAAQFTPHGASAEFCEGWTPLSATQKLIDAPLDDISTVDERTLSSTLAFYNSLSEADQAQLTGAEKLAPALN